MAQNPLENELLRGGGAVAGPSRVPNQGGLAPPVAPRVKIPDAPVARARGDSVVRPINQLQAAPPPPPPPGLQAAAPAMAPAAAPALAPPTPEAPAGMEAAAPAPEAPQAPLVSAGETRTRVEPDGTKVTEKLEPAPVQEAPARAPAQQVEDKVTGEAMARFKLQPGSVQAQRMGAAVNRQLTHYGAYPGRDDPAAPQPQINPVGRNFNPMTGQFTPNPAQKGPSIGQILGLPSDEEYAKEYQGAASGRV